MKHISKCCSRVNGRHDRNAEEVIKARDARMSIEGHSIAQEVTTTDEAILGIMPVLLDNIAECSVSGSGYDFVVCIFQAQGAQIQWHTDDRSEII